MKPYARLLQRIADAMVFANTGNFREFEELPVKRDRRTSRTAPTVFTLPLNEAMPR